MLLVRKERSKGPETIGCLTCSQMWQRSHSGQLCVRKTVVVCEAQISKTVEGVWNCGKNCAYSNTQRHREY